MRVRTPDFDGPINRMLAIPRTSADLLNKLEAVRLLCQETGCAQRYLAGDALTALLHGTRVIDEETGSDYQSRVRAYLDHVYANDLTLGIAMTDAKGDRSLRPSQQTRDRRVRAHRRAARRRHRDLRHEGDRDLRALRARAAGHALPQHGRGRSRLRRVLRGADRRARASRSSRAPPDGPGEAAAKFSGRYGQSTGVCLFDRVFVPWERVFFAGEWQHASEVLYDYTAQHRHTCIAARAGFGDLLIGAGALVTEANGLDLDRAHGVRDAMVELIKIVEGFYACGVAASVYAKQSEAGSVTPDPVFANIGKLLMATQIYDMHRLAHQVSGGMIVTLPGPAEDHNPATAGRLSEVLTARSDIPYEKRIEVARFLEDLTASHQAGWYSVISLHGGGSPEAMKTEIYRHYPIGSKVDLVERLLDRGVLADETRKITRNRQPGRCCAVGCFAPDTPRMLPIAFACRRTAPHEASAEDPLAAD